MAQTDEPTIDPAPLTHAQRLGDACVVCRKKWPRPRIRVGRLPDTSAVFACEDCVPVSSSAVGPWRPSLQRTTRRSLHHSDSP
nr:hypothetical protein [Actinomadura graeca]